MENLITHFVRMAPGKWTCVRPGEFHSPDVHIQVAIGTTFTRGTIIMGVDVARSLEEQYARSRCGTSPQAPRSVPSSIRNQSRPPSPE